MKRINIFGNAGSGKSTLARMIGDRLNVPVVHLDKLFWEPGWHEADVRIFRERVAGAVSGDAWVCDGNYATKTFDLRVPQADLNICLDVPRLHCAVRVLLRSMGAKHRPDLPAGCREGNILNTIQLVMDVWNFDATRRGRIDTELTRLAKAETVRRLKLQSEISKFLASI